MHAVQVAIALGANLGDPSAQLRQAMQGLAQLPMSGSCRHSAIYRSTPLRGGPAGQPDYANAVTLMETGLAPLELLDRLQAMEAHMGRVRHERWGARELDLDVLVMGTLSLHHPRLQLPHPELAKRDFVLQPLAEIAPQLSIPGLGTVASCLARLAPPRLPVWD